MRKVASTATTSEGDKAKAAAVGEEHCEDDDDEKEIKEDCPSLLSFEELHKKAAAASAGVANMTGSEAAALAEGHNKASESEAK